MKLKKLIAVSSALIMSLGVLTGCSSTSNSSSGGNSGNNSAKSLVFADTQSPNNLNPTKTGMVGMLVDMVSEKHFSNQMIN